MGYIRYSYHHYGFRSNSGLRNTLGIEKAYQLELKKSPLGFEVAINTYELSYSDMSLNVMWTLVHEKTHFKVPKMLGILFEEYLELRCSMALSVPLKRPQHASSQLVCVELYGAARTFPMCIYLCITKLS